MLWDLLQEMSHQQHRDTAASLEERVSRLETELEETRSVVRRLMEVLEENIGRDIDGDGAVGPPTG